jgi:hypothetical protein
MHESTALGHPSGVDANGRVTQMGCSRAGLGRGRVARRLTGSLLAGLLVAGCGGGGATPSPTARIGTAQIRAAGPRVAGFGGTFAGALFTGRVQSVDGQWQVPGVRPGSQAGRAATWIGAQAPGAPFIQIGTREELEGSGARGTPLYEAFWADTVRGLHPLSLFPVRPGDTVAAHMSLARGRWTLSIEDTRSGRHRSVSTTEEGSGDFELALWLQEDPTVTATGHAFPYPDLSPTHISALAVNGRPPAPASLRTTWMALPHAYLGPSAPAGNAFSVLPQRLAAVGRSYLAITEPADAQLMRFYAVSATWRQGVSQKVVHAAIGRLIRALGTYVNRLRAAAWPADVSGRIDRLADAYGAEATALRRALTQGPGAVLAALPHGSGGRTQAQLADGIRRDLALPTSSY